jgi:hypothetical protein
MPTLPDVSANLCVPGVSALAFSFLPLPFLLLYL